MNCPNCGANINQNESFCGSCGAKLSNGTQENKYINNSDLSAKRKMNKNAIYSIICSGICYIIFWWLGIVGIILGIQSLNEIKTSNEKGKTIAIAGIVLGAGAIILFVHTYILK